jgi:hypothetical protein
VTDLPYPAETPRKREDLPDKGAGSPAPWGLRAAARFGQTLGKFLFRIKVVQWSDGHLPTPRESAIRALVPGVFLLIAFIGGPFFYAAVIAAVIYLTSIADTLYRGIHDKTSNTIELFAPGGLARRK